MYSPVGHGKCPRRLVSSKKVFLLLVSRHIWFTIDLIPGCEVILVLRAAIGGVAYIILVVRAPIGGVAYFRFYPFAVSRKI